MTLWLDPATFADDALSAGELNAGLGNNMRVIGDPWPPYDVTLFAWTLVNGTLEGWAQMLGKEVHGRIEYTVGAGDTKAGIPTFSLPALPLVVSQRSCLGHAGLFDTSAANRLFRFAILTTTGGGSLGLSDQNDVRVSDTVPWTWATGDQMLIDFRYEGA